MFFCWLIVCVGERVWYMRGPQTSHDAAVTTAKMGVKVSSHVWVECIKSVFYWTHHEHHEEQRKQPNTMMNHKRLGRAPRNSVGLRGRESGTHTPHTHTTDNCQGVREESSSVEDLWKDTQTNWEGQTNSRELHCF